MKLSKIMENLNPSKAKGVSFTASLLCVFIYISFFYIFDISPSNLLNNTRFWFFISNTLILIIAADYGSFSSSKLNQEDISYHNEVSMSSQSQEARSNNNNYYHHNISPPHTSLLVSLRIPELMDKRIVVYNSPNQQANCENTISKKMENNLRQNVATRETSARPSMIEKELEGLDDNSIHRRSMFVRSKSDIAIKDHADDDNKNTLHRCESEKHEKMIAHDDEDEENELSNLSDEELNRRVEEFIQKFNAHLRLQAEATKSGHYM